MCKKFIYLMSFVLVLVLAGNASAVDLTWDAGGDGSSFNDSDNWGSAGVPGGGDLGNITGGTVVIDGYNAAVNRIKGDGMTLNVINGGKLDVTSGGYLTPSNETSPVGNSEINVDATSEIDAYQMYGAYQPGTQTTFNLWGYTRFYRPDSADALRMTILSGATCYVNIYAGGVLRTDGIDDGPGTALLTIYGGTLILEGNVTPGSYIVNSTGGAVTYYYDSANDDTIVTPEPATVALLGLGGLVLLRKRR